MKASVRIVILIACMIGFSGSLQAQCPFGDKVNCLGECGRFTDENSDTFCDYSKVESTQTAAVEEDTITEQETVQEPKKIKQTSENKPQNQVQIRQEPKTEAAALETETAIPESETPTTQIIEQKQETKKPKPYNVITISCICLGLYLLTFLLVRTGKIKKLTHRKIWNVALLITFLVSCLLGFLLALQLNYHFGMSLLRPILKLHVEFGIAMTIVAVFHLIWHLKYYSKILKK